MTASAATPAQAAGARAIPTVRRASVDANDMPSTSFQQRRRVAGMLVYHASEKDCVGEDGNGPQECVICFEEFAVGDEMGRLECLCKFHKVRKFEPSPKMATFWKRSRGLIRLRRLVYGNGGRRRNQVRVRCIRRVPDLLGSAQLVGCYDRDCV